MNNYFWANWRKDKPLGNIENLLKDSPELMNTPDFNVKDLVEIRSHKHLKTALHGVSGTVETVYPTSGTYLIKLHSSGETVLLNKYELIFQSNFALNL